MTDNEINIVIGSWGSYNECNERALGSKWICLNDYEDWEEIIAELKKQGFILGGIDEELFVQDIENFPANAKNWDLKSLCNANNWRLVNVCKNHYCFSAFIKGGTENKCVYLSISDVRYFSNDWYKHILIRTAQNETDYCGGFNNYTTLERLEGKIAEMLSELPF